MRSAVNTSNPRFTSINTPIRFSRSLLCIAVTMSLALTACSDNDDEEPAVSTEVPVPTDTRIPMGTFAVAMNDGESSGSVTIYSPDLSTKSRVFNTGANQGITVTSDGTLYHNADLDGDAGIRAINRISDRMDMDTKGASDRTIGTAPGKGLFAIAESGLLASCDVTDDSADLKFYSSTAGEGAQAVGSIDLPASCWDGFYADSDDRVYLALTDGTLAIIDNFEELDLLQGGEDDSIGGDVVDRLLSVVDAEGMQQSVNFHGVWVENGTVLVSDVGSAASPTDGALYVFSDNGIINGELNIPAIAGPATRLGNPVDVILVDGTAIVAEKSNDAILVFHDVASLGGDVAPGYQLPFTKPESLVALDEDMSVQDATDIVGGDSVSRLLVSQNPGPVQDMGNGAGNANVGRIAIIDFPGVDPVVDDGLDVSVASVNGDPGVQSFLTLENIQLAADGKGYAVFDTTDGATVQDRGILVLNNLANREDDDSDLTRIDRMIASADAGLTSPKGIEIAGEKGALIVSDLGNDGTPASLVVLSTNAGSNVMPMFIVTNTGNAAIWDADYDAANDRLYAAGTAGDILVYDSFFATGASSVPTRSFRVMSEDVTSNMHGIAYDEASDMIFVTDVGSAASPSDGSFHIIENASTATGMVATIASISGPASLLGNPVDLAFDGSSVYIAEKSNDRVLIYRNVMALRGEMDMAADATIAIAKPESVTLQLQ